MILGGIDVSGDQESGNYKHMAIVICTQEGANLIRKHVGFDHIHMNQILDRKEHIRIISALRFDGKQCIAFCIKTDRNGVIDRVQSRRTTRKNIPRTRLIRTYNYILWHHVRDRIVGFLAEHGADLHDVCFQCDSDCDHFAKESSLRHTTPGIVHGYADGVAWANGKDMEPVGTIFMDLTQELEEKMVRKCAK